MIVDNLDPPYYAVIFSTIQTVNTDGYIEAVERMNLLAKKQKGFLGMESARSAIGITVSYWESEEAILQWKHNIEHTAIRELGRKKWYQQYQLRICKVERTYGFEN